MQIGLSVCDGCDAVIMLHHVCHAIIIPHDSEIVQRIAQN